MLQNVERCIDHNHAFSRECNCHKKLSNRLFTVGLLKIVVIMNLSSTCDFCQNKPIKILI